MAAAPCLAHPWGVRPVSAQPWPCDHVLAWGTCSRPGSPKGRSRPCPRKGGRFQWTTLESAITREDHGSPRSGRSKDNPSWSLQRECGLPVGLAPGSSEPSYKSK